jgi:hypothetical protein
VAHASKLPHCPQPSHVSTPVPAHCVTPGVHTGDGAQEQLPQVQPAVHA